MPLVSGEVENPTDSVVAVPRQLFTGSRPVERGGEADAGFEPSWHNGEAVGAY